MAVLIGLLLVLFCIGVVLYPFLKARRTAEHGGQVDSLEGLALRRRAIYDEIGTLELERALGNVEEEEYQRLLRYHRLAAAGTFREQESLELHLEEADRALEQEVLRLRGQRLLDGNDVGDTEEESGP